MSAARKYILVIGFACAAGWSDVICFRRYQSFAALMTGNTVKAGIASATQTEKDFDRWLDVVYYISILLSYIAGGVIFEAVKARKPNKAGMILAPCCLALNVLSDVLFKLSDVDDLKATRWQVCLLSPTFGIQNSLSFGGSMAVNTTIITGNSQKMSQCLYQLCSGKLTTDKAKSFVPPLLTILSTLLAACAGAFVLMDVSGMDASWLFLPSGVLQAVMMCLHDYVLVGVEPARKGLTPSLNNTAEISISSAPEAKAAESNEALAAQKV
mmetsp:Transcript_10262/g.18954  ORF Transcript_10262/g.18954 Transcript_10262/m.18954 type:complete len:269 (-) Transcript_10262:392-1198(-)